jgi:hypothetical protein
MNICSCIDRHKNLLSCLFSPFLNDLNTTKRLGKSMNCAWLRHKHHCMQLPTFLLNNRPNRWPRTLLKSHQNLLGMTPCLFISNTGIRIAIHTRMSRGWCLFFFLCGDHNNCVINNIESCTDMTRINWWSKINSFPSSRHQSRINRTTRTSWSISCKHRMKLIPCTITWRQRMPLITIPLSKT